VVYMIPRKDIMNIIGACDVNVSQLDAFLLKREGTLSRPR
jgi:hypothetical protein